MPKKPYASSGYIIIPKLLFLEYMISAKRFAIAFLKKYPFGSKCPFKEVGPDSTNVQENANNRCLGSIMERYFNVWGSKNSIKFVFAVDYQWWRYFG